MAQPPTKSENGMLELHVKPSQNFKVTGDGSAAAWNDASWLSLPQREKTGPNLQTKIKLLYSDSGMYCLFSCDDIRITSTLNEDFANLFNEDVVEIFFWPDEGIPVYFEYELSPHNFELAILVPNWKGTFLGWRPWHYKGNRITRHATKIALGVGGASTVWTAEFFIPYALLTPLGNVPPHKGVHWRANMYRIDYDQGISTWSWQLTDKTFHEFNRFGILVFD